MGAVPFAGDGDGVAAAEGEEAVAVLEAGGDGGGDGGPVRGSGRGTRTPPPAARAARVSFLLETGRTVRGIGRLRGGLGRRGDVMPAQGSRHGTRGVFFPTVLDEGAEGEGG